MMDPVRQKCLHNILHLGCLANEPGVVNMHDSYPGVEGFKPSFGPLHSDVGRIQGIPFDGNMCIAWSERKHS